MPAIPIIAAVGGAATAAAPVVAAGAGIYSAVKGIQGAKDAASAARQNANAAAGAGQASQDAQLQAYFNSNPAFLAEYNRNKAATGDRRSPTEWMAGGINENPEEAQRYAAFNQASGVIPGSAMGPGGTVDVNLLQQQAQAVARQNAANSAALEQQYNPGAAEVRSGSLESLLASINAPQQGIQGTLPTVPTASGPMPVSAANEALLAQVAAQAGQPLENVGYDSPLTRAAIAQAQTDLALGGLLPQDVRNLVARNAFARSGSVSGGLGLGRDIVARDLGLTSLDLQRARMQQALQAGAAEAGLESGNAAMRLTADQFARNNLLQSQGATAQNQAAQQAAWAQQQALMQQAASQEASNYFNQNSLLQSIQSGEFARNLAAAQFGQNIAQPMSGLDPGSIANIAVGNSNTAANANQQALATQAAAGNQQAQFGGQLIGAAIEPAIGALKKIFTPTTPKTFGTAGYTPPNTSYISNIIPGFA